MKNKEINTKESKFKSILMYILVFCMLIGGVGGCIIAFNNEDSVFGKISLLCFLPMMNVWLWQWLEDKKYKKSKENFFKVSGILLSLLIIIGMFLFGLHILHLLIVLFVGYIFISMGYICIEALIEASWKDRVKYLIIFVIGVILIVSMFLEAGWLKFLIYAIFAYFYIATIGLIYSVIKKRNLDENPIFGIRFFNAYFFYIGAFFGLTFFFMTGFEKALFFLPESWGFIDEEGEFTTYRIGISIMSGMVSSGFLLYLLERFSRRKDSEGS